MPFFEAGQSDSFEPRYNTTPDYQPAPEFPSGGDIVGSALRQGNSVVSLYSDKTRRVFPPVEGYSPADDIGPNDPLFARRDRFVASASPAETAAIKSQIAMEERDKRTLAASGWAGTVASIGAGVADPTMWWVPGGIAARGGSTALRIAGEAAFQSAAQEAALHATQQTRTLGESAGNVASSTLLGGLLGGAASLLTRGEHAALAAKMDRDRGIAPRETAAPPPDTLSPAGPEETRPPIAPTAEVTSPSEPAAAPAAREEAGAGAAMPSGTELPPEQTLRDRILAAAGEPNQRVRIADVHAALPDVPLADLHAELIDMQNNKGDLALMQLDNRREVTPEDEAAKIMVGDDPRHLLWVIPKGHPEARSAGAEATGAGELAAAPRTPASQELKFASAFGLEKFSVDPKMSLMNSPLTTARRFAAEFGEMPLETEANLKGETTTIAGGAPTETLTKLHLRTAEQGVTDDMRDLYRDMRWNGKKMPWYGELGDAMRLLGRPAEMPTYEQFTAMVSEAQMNGNKHDIPQVAEAARRITERREPWAKRAEDLGLLTRRTDEPYLTHDWNKKLIRERRQDVVDKFAEHFAGEQAIKRGLQSELTGLSAKLDEAEATIARLSRGGERSESGEAKLDAAHIASASVRAEIEKAVEKWQGKSSKEAKAALKGRAEYEAERRRKAAERGEAAPSKRLKGADAEVDKAVKRILESSQDLSADELRERAHETVDHILGTPDGRIYNEGGAIAGPSSDARGSQARRTFNISNADAFPWLRQDAEKTSKRWFRTMIPDILIAERYGDVEAKGALQQILDEHTALSDAARGNAKQTLKLDTAKDEAITNVAFLRDKLRGVYDQPANESEKMVRRVIGMAKNYNAITSLGAAGVNSLTDAGALMMKQGLLTTFSRGLLPYVTSLMSGGELNKEVLRQAKAAAISIDWDLAARHHGLADIIDDYADGSMFERTLQAGASKMQLLNLQAPWTDRIKAITFQIAAPEMKRGMEALLAGSADSRQLRILGAANINKELAEKILKQYDKHGVEIDGVHLPNVADWKDIKAKEAFQGALIREADTTIVTPGIGDAPKLMSNSILGWLGQFKQFTAAAHTRILLSNLQRRDAQVLSGLVGSVGMGMLTYKIGSLTGGSPTSDSPSDWVKEGISRSSLLGWIEESNAGISKLTRGQLDVYKALGSSHPMSRQAGRSVVEQLFGPTVGKIEGASQVIGAIASGEWKYSDTHAGRKLIPLQNAIWLRGTLNEVERAFNSQFGIPEKEP